MTDEERDIAASLARTVARNLTELSLFDLHAVKVEDEFVTGYVKTRKAGFDFRISIEMRRDEGEAQKWRDQ